MQLAINRRVNSSADAAAAKQRYLRERERPRVSFARLCPSREACKEEKWSIGISVYGY